MNVTGYFNVSSFPPSIMNRTAYTLSDDVSWIRGRHNFAFGGSLARAQVLLREGVALKYGDSELRSD